jgi:hypothetical protein
LTCYVDLVLYREEIVTVCEMRDRLHVLERKRKIKALLFVHTQTFIVDRRLDQHQHHIPTVKQRRVWDEDCFLIFVIWHSIFQLSIHLIYYYSYLFSPSKFCLIIFDMISLSISINIEKWDEKKNRCLWHETHVLILIF